MRYRPPMPMVAILTLLLIATPSINSAHSSLQQELTIQNMGNILYQDNFADTILFQYGAESGVLQPPWDLVGPAGSGSKTGSYVQVDNAYARTGSQAVKFYQVPPPKSDAQRRVGLREYDTGLNEYYLSWWAYFPSDDNWAVSPFITWGNTIGGVQSFWENSNGTIYNTSWRFGWDANNRKLYVMYGRPFGYPDYQNFDGVTYYIGDYLDQWVHFQLYVKWSTTGTGIYRAWFNDNLVAEITGLTNDPRGWSQWVSEGCSFIWTSNPYIVLELYQSQDSPESWYEVDDIVASTTKVPESYEVHG